jgi:sec-independent protein translocase protein TatA
MPALGPWELIIVLLIVVIIFGAGRLADIGGALGKSVREFRGAVKSPEEEKAEKELAAAAAATPNSTSPNATAASTAVAPAAAPAGAATATENKCPSCATVNPPAQVFCGQCGTRLTRAA